MRDSVELLHPISVPNDPPRLERGSLDADVVVLAGTVGHEAPWTRGWPRPALPLASGSMIESLIDRLGTTLAGTLALCVNGRAEWLGQQVRRAHQYGTAITVRRDAMPRGSAGCVRDCREDLSGRTILAMGASVWLDDDPTWLLRQHREAGNALTIFCTRDPLAPTRGRLGVLRPTSLFCCEPSALELVRPSGFQDVKEQLVPALRRAGLRVGAVVVLGNTCEVTDWESYMRVLVHDLSERGDSSGAHCPAPQVYCGDDVEIGTNARLVGPLWLGNRCRIADRALLIGPMILADDCVVEADARLIRVVAPVAATFPQNTSITDLFVADHPGGRPEVAERDRRGLTLATTDERGDRIAHPERGAAPTEAYPIPTVARSENRADGNPTVESSTPVLNAKSIATWLSLPAVLGAAFVWAFWHPLRRLWEVWQSNPDYGVGQLVPLATAYLMYTRRATLKGWNPLRWWPGVVVFLTGVTVAFAGEWYAFPFLAFAGTVLGANGVLMSLLGRHRFKTFLYPMLFLFLACPLPQRLHEAVMLPLQTLGASISSGILELVGIPALRSGHVLEVAGRQVAVAEACSGLRMVMALVVVVAFVADLVSRPAWQRGVLLLSAVPIALACNILRIVGAVFLYHIELPWLAEGAFHDAAGLAMVPIALAAIVLELRWLDALSRPTRNPVILGSGTHVRT